MLDDLINRLLINMTPEEVYNHLLEKYSNYIQNYYADVTFAFMICIIFGVIGFIVGSLILYFGVKKQYEYAAGMGGSIMTISLIATALFTYGYTSSFQNDYKNQLRYKIEQHENKRIEAKKLLYGYNKKEVN